MHLFFKHTLKSCLLVCFWMFATLFVNAQEVPQAITQNELGTQIKNIKDTTEIKNILQYVEDNGSIISSDTSIGLLQNIATASKQTGYTSGVILSLVDLGNIYAKIGRYQEAFNVLYEAAAYAVGSKEFKNLLTEVYIAISSIYHVQGDYNKMANYLYQSAQLSEQLGNVTNVDAIYNNLAALSIEMKQYDQAIIYLDKAQQLGMANKNYYLVGNVLVNKAITYAYQKNYKKSNETFQLAQYVAKKYNLPRIQYSILVNLSQQALNTHQPQKSIQYLQQALAMNIHAGGFYDNAIASMMSEAYVNLHQYKLAESILLKAEISAKNANLKNNLREIYRVLTLVNDSLGNYKNAIDYYDKYITLKDSMYNEMVTQNRNLLDVKYRTAQTNKELLAKQLLITGQTKDLAVKNSWIIAISSGMLLLAIVFIAFYRSYKHKTELEQLKASMAGEEKERNRIGQELHDGIGGMLTAIKMNLNTARKIHPELMQVKNIDEVIAMVQDTAAEVRKTAHNLMPDVLLRYTLPEALLLYNEQISSGDLKIDFHFYGDLNAIDKPLALSIYRIIQEFMQNVMKHANASHAEIQIHRNEDTITITIEDNGVGFDDTLNGNGLGLQNLKTRVAALQGYISIESAKGKGMTAYIEFDLKKTKPTFA